MIDRVIPERDLIPFCTGDDLASRARGLLRQQMATWGLLRNGYDSLDTVKTRTFEFDGFVVNVQYNPGRLTSSSAKVDQQSIKERKCFLCPRNLPAEQLGLSYRDEYLILCNPFPIFPEHFTLSHKDHTAQQISSSFETLLDLSKELSKGYTVFYNGPRCGASAPDHLHFQAGNKQFMPIDNEYEGIKKTSADQIGKSEFLQAYSVEKYLRRFVSLESKDCRSLLRAFEIFYKALYEVSIDNNEVQVSRGEPMMNILAAYDNGEWRVILFPRAKHRPSFFFFEGEKRILLSPAAVDLGGACITPLERDFEKITRENIVDMFSEVSLSADVFGRLKKRLSHELAAP
jgi:ATP adenylyltransferase/5',5'''-P-1,P-4-tetraphosphate phosphorylase II